MRIAINARSILLANRTGIGRYTYHLLDSLGAQDTGNDYWLYARKKLWDRKRFLPNFPYSQFTTKADYFNLGPSHVLKGADIYHSPSPDHLDIEGPKIVVTLHDLIYKTFPQGHTQETIDLTDQHMQQIIKKADHIISVSQHTRDDLHRLFDFPKEKSSVVYNGVDHKTFYPLDVKEKGQAKEELAQMGLTQPFILFVGTIEPRKNLARLIEAFDQLRRQNQFQGDLAVVGMKGWMGESIGPLLQKLNIKEHVRFLGFMTDEQLRILYNQAEVFAFPSLYEGFGFPIVEAFCCGAAVVTSNTSSCREIAGDAALTVDPQNTKKLTDAMAQLLQDHVLNGEYRRKALLRANDFSFTKTAAETLNIYEQLNRG